jgi:hypothetical protein
MNAFLWTVVVVMSVKALWFCLIEPGKPFAFGERRIRAGLAVNIVLIAWALLLIAGPQPFGPRY